jgi:hypothetical protein
VLDFGWRKTNEGNLGNLGVDIMVGVGPTCMGFGGGGDRNNYSCLGRDFLRVLLKRAHYTCRWTSFS